MNQTPPSQNHLPGLNGLRGLACLAVFGVHFHQHTGVTAHAGPFQLGRFLVNGNTGVALFFILSGFLLGLPWWNDNSDTTNPPPLGTPYLLKRIARILPAYYLCLSALILIHGYGLSPKQLIDVVLHYLFLHNYTEFSFYSISDPFWTLAVQAQFYVLLPILLAVLGPLRRGVNNHLLCLTLLVLAGAVYALHAWIMTQAKGVDPWPFPTQIVARQGVVLSHSLLAHLPHFLIGVAAGCLSVSLNHRLSNNPPPSRIGSDLVFWFAACSIVLILATPLDKWFTLPHGRYHFPYVPLLIAAVIIVTPWTATARSLLTSRPLEWIGVISYGLYVYHLPCQNITAKLMTRLGMPVTQSMWLFGLLSLALSIAVAGTSHRVVERPILAVVRRRIARR